MAYVTPGTVAAGDVATAAAWNVITNDVIALRGAQINIQSTTKTDVSTTNSTSFVDVSGLSVSITPTQSDSNILVLVTMIIGNTSASDSSLFKLQRDSTDIYIGDASSNRGRVSSGSMQHVNTNHVDSIAISFLDTGRTPGTSAIAYKVVFKTSGNFAVVNRGGADADAASHPRTPSTITVIEVPV